MTSPLSRASAKRAAVKVFVIDPISNSVSSSAPVPAEETVSPSTLTTATWFQWLLPSASAVAP